MARKNLKREATQAVDTEMSLPTGNARSNAAQPVSSNDTIADSDITMTGDVEPLGEARHVQQTSRDTSKLAL